MRPSSGIFVEIVGGFEKLNVVVKFPDFYTKSIPSQFSEAKRDIAHYLLYRRHVGEEVFGLLSAGQVHHRGRIEILVG